MNRLFSFAAGALCGAAVGAVVALLITPASGEELKDEMLTRWNEALEEAQQAETETRERLEQQFNQASNL